MCALPGVRLPAALFAGAREPDELSSPPTPAQREAYTAWAEFYEKLDSYADRSLPRGRPELTRLHGEPSMMALVLSRWPTPTRESVQEFFDWIKR